MDTYSLLREIADSWGLLALTLIFLGVVVFAFRPGSKELHADIAEIPLRNDISLGEPQKSPEMGPEDRT